MDELSNHHQPHKLPQLFN